MGNWEILRASWLVPVVGPPVEGGALVVQGGRIAAVGPWHAVRNYPGRVREFPGCALVPGLVNAHTHLELTGLGPPVSGTSGFAAWILEVARRKRAAPREHWERAVAHGARQCLESGQLWVADVVSQPEALSRPGLPRFLVFPEVLAPWPDRVGPSAGWADRALKALGSLGGGLAPHAPYSTCAEAFRVAVDQVRGHGRRLMIHLAESLDEIRFCTRGDGPIAEVLYAGLDLPAPPSPGEHPVEWLDRIGALGPRTVLVHAVHLDDGHVTLLKNKGTRIVLCPRSNRTLSGGVARGRAYLDAGMDVGLGTDSVLSSGSLDLWADIRAAVEDYGWSPEEALSAATTGGARVLGLGRDVGRFAVGSRADILAVAMGPGREVLERIVDGGKPVSVWFEGREVWRAAWGS